MAAGDQKVLTDFSPYLIALARLSDIEIMQSELPDADAPVAIVGEFKLMLKIEIDVVVERGRIAKEIARIKLEIVRSETKLANLGFIEHAPTKIVAQEKDRLYSFSSTLEKLSKQLNKLH